MVHLKALDNIKNFLYCKENFINLFENNIHVFNFINLINISEISAQFEFCNFKVSISGEGFVVKKMLKNEILIQGKIKKMEYEYYE